MSALGQQRTFLFAREIISPDRVAEFGLWGRAPIPDTREIAEKGLRRNQADFAMIIDLDLNAGIVETIGPHA
jgi:hypothetical protein